ncbi:hypothetical protein EG329_006836 [Mollisiaceae sp. DMI_Dod_QoI]|nr:hypothetical protein EG329_006836 [Helotiales sp. DMI_Dod_QoI]
MRLLELKTNGEFSLTKNLVNNIPPYAYLSDVSTRSSGWESAFRKSRWFTRGWTLQELIAPRSVEFFSKEATRLGDKSTLEQQVHEVTGVPISALRGEPLSSFSVDESKRETKREENKAYSLWGLFGIYMSPYYGEGATESFKRLRNKIKKHSQQVWEDITDASISAGQDERNVFDLVPTNEAAQEIVRDPANFWGMKRDPDDPSKQFLRIGFHPPSKTPGFLVKFDRYASTSDVVLGIGWSKID